MKTKNIKHKSVLRTSVAAMAFLLLVGISAASAEDKDTADLQDSSTKIDDAVKPLDTAKVTAEIATKFTTLAGSDANATALVTGLHDGTAVTLTSTVNGQVVTDTFTPTTGKQGFGNVYITLTLAQEELTKLGITNPTPAQLQAVLNGGSVTTASGSVTVSGILALRASGQGWGQIAKTLDVKLGHVMREMHAARESFEHHNKTDVAVDAHVTTTDRPGDVAKTATDRVERVVRPEKPERVERVTAVEVDRPVRIEKPVLPERLQH